jgi:hypothetical protein
MFPKRGNTFPKLPDGKPAAYYRSAIAGSLKAELGDTHQAIKTVRKWTGASERTVKNWFAARNSPGSEHLIILLGHSDRVLDVVLRLANRPTAVAGIELMRIREALSASLHAIDALVDENPTN